MPPQTTDAVRARSRYQGTFGCLRLSESSTGMLSGRTKSSPLVENPGVGEHL